MTDSKYYFYQADHLGNNRVVTDAAGSVIRQNHDDPYGLSLAESTAQEV